MKEEEEKRQGEKDEANDDDNDVDRGGKKTHTRMEVREKRERNTEMPMVVLVAGRDAVGTVVYSHRFDRLCVCVCVCVGVLWHRINMQHTINTASVLVFIQVLSNRFYVL